MKAVCLSGYQNPDEILNYFHLFVSDEFRLWYLNSSLKNIEELENEFNKEVYRLQKKYEDNLHLKQNNFLPKLKTKFKNDSSVLSEIEKYPLSSFFKYKSLMIKEMYPSISDTDFIRMVIFMFDNDEVKLKLIKYLKASFRDVFDTLRILDEINKSI